MAIDPEFVLTIGQDMKDELGPNELPKRAIEFISPGIEIHNYHFRFGEPSI